MNKDPAPTPDTGAAPTGSPDSALITRPRETQEYFFQEGCYILELANDPKDDALSIARARAPPGSSTHWHRLTATVERYVMLQGEGLVEVGEHPPCAVIPGDVVRIPAHARQRITNTGTEDLIFLALCTPRFRPENYAEV